MLRPRNISCQTLFPATIVRVRITRENEDSGDVTCTDDSSDTTLREITKRIAERTRFPTVDRKVVLKYRIPSFNDVLGVRAF